MMLTSEKPKRLEPTMARYSLNLPTESQKDLNDPRFLGIRYRRGGAGQPTPVVRGTGLRVQTIVIAVRDWGMPTAEAAREFGLSEAQVDECLCFYEAHRAEIDAVIQAEEAMQPTHA
jgi:uncharacterized protein (DUF433 family)